MRAYSSLCIALPAAALFVSVASAQPQPKSKWTMNSDSKEVSLVYGDDSEESDLIFTCKPRSNSVHIFVGETDASLKPNQKATASLSAGSASASISGKTLANELAGVPSFTGELSATDPLFDALREARRKLAADAGVPPYVIFHDSTLREIAARKPSSLKDLSAVQGVGAVKLERYGQAMIDALSTNG